MRRSRARSCEDANCPSEIELAAMLVGVGVILVCCVCCVRGPQAADAGRARNPSWWCFCHRAWGACVCVGGLPRAPRAGEVVRLLDIC